MSSHTTTDHKEIRAWAERHEGKPATVKRTHDGGDVGIVRLMFPKATQSHHDALEEITWDEFFEKFDEAALALVYDPKTNFNKIVGHETPERREQGEHNAARHKK